MTNYNHATTNLTIYSNSTSQEHRICSLLLSSRCMTNYMKTCSFLHANFTKTIKVFENLFLKILRWTSHLLKRHMLLVHIGIASMRQFQCVPTTLVTENKKNYFDIYTNILMYQVSCSLSLPLLSISNFQCLSLYCKLLIVVGQLYLQIWVHELPTCIC